MLHESTTLNYDLHAAKLLSTACRLAVPGLCWTALIRIIKTTTRRLPEASLLYH